MSFYSFFVATRTINACLISVAVTDKIEIYANIDIERVYGLLFNEFS